MTLQSKYIIFVLVTSSAVILIGIGLLVAAYRRGARRKEFKLALGNGLIALFAAILSAFVAEILKPTGSDQPAEVKSGERALLSDPGCLDHWYLTGEIWHYSLTRAQGSSAWQVARPAFTRLPTRIHGRGVWLNTLDRTRYVYDIEVGCRGNRGIWIFTQAVPEAFDTIPTVEVYPELPGDVQQTQLVGYAIDQTWDEHEVLAPVMISRKPLHGSENIGPIVDTNINKHLSALWREHYDRHTTRLHECTVCATLTAP